MKSQKLPTCPNHLRNERRVAHDRVTECDGVCVSAPITTGEGGRPEGTALDPGALPGSAFFSGLSHPAALWKGALRWTAGSRRSVRGFAGRGH